LFIADRVAPAFRFCLGNSTLTQAFPIRYPFFLFVSHHCNTYTPLFEIFANPVDFAALKRYTIF
ncbi:MAG: hypothetical protein ACOYKJ_05245, partial [Candidatus Howiella sp.]